MILTGIYFVIGIWLGLVILTAAPWVVVMIAVMAVRILRGMIGVLRSLPTTVAELNNIIAPGAWDDMVKR